MQATHGAYHAASHAATLLRALARLRAGHHPAGDAADRELLDALDALLRRPDELAAAPVARAPSRDEARATPEPALSDAEPEPPPMAPPLRAARDPRSGSAAPSAAPARGDERLAGAPASLQRVVERADLATPARSIPPARDDRVHATSEPAPSGAPIESLFALRRVRGIVREMTTLTGPSGAIDLAAAVRMVARAEPITRLPRRRASMLGHIVLWLFDAGPAMLPFAADKQQLAAVALRLLGRDRVRIADFVGSPLEAVRPQRQVRWAALHWPPRGSAVVVVSDFGVGGREAGLREEAWRQFVGHASARGLRSVALSPYVAARWPAAVAAFDTALAWDHDVGVQRLRRARSRHRAN